VVQLLRVAEAPDIAGDEHARPGCEAILEVRESAEPLQLHGPGAVGDDRLEEAPAIAQRDDTGARHGAGEQALCRPRGLRSAMISRRSS
jgi:hypothetical protein